MELNASHEASSVPSSSRSRRESQQLVRI
jgi:hypothetical protein